VIGIWDGSTVGTKSPVPEVYWWVYFPKIIRSRKRYNWTM